MKNLIKLMILTMTLSMSMNAFSKKVLKLAKKDCKVKAIFSKIEVKNNTTYDWAPGSKIKFKTNAPESAVFGLSSAVLPGGAVLIPIYKAAKKCKAKVILP